jgi:uncharacterized small protein (DUF1192 family)
VTNFDEFKKAAAETAEVVADKSIVFAKKVADKTKCVARIAVLRAEISSEKDLLRNNFKELGKVYYNAHKQDPEPALAQLCTDVSVTAERILAKRREIEQLKEQLKDDEPEDASYTVDETVDTPDTDEPETEEEPEQAHCCCSCGCADAESAVQEDAPAEKEEEKPAE